MWKKRTLQKIHIVISTCLIRAFTFPRRHLYPLTWVHTPDGDVTKSFTSFYPACWKLRFNGDTSVAGCSWRLKLPSDRRCTRRGAATGSRRALARQRYHFISDPAGGLASALTVGVKKKKKETIKTLTQRKGRTTSPESAYNEVELLLRAGHLPFLCKSYRRL